LAAGDAAFGAGDVGAVLGAGDVGAVLGAGDVGAVLGAGDADTALGAGDVGAGLAGAAALGVAFGVGEAACGPPDGLGDGDVA
jgi:hypothetical protein